MKRLWIAVTFLVACTVVLAGQTKPAKPLEIYVVDPEGGKEALWVTPAGQAILIDTGSPGGRDTDRIMDVIDELGIKKLDILLSTHYHVDHVGGLQELLKRIPVDHFYDHGETIEDGLNGHQKEQVPGFQAWYFPMVAKAPRTVLKPGDRIPVTGLDWRIVTSAGKVLKTPLPGAGKPNPLCAGAQRRTVTQDPEDGQSVGSVITYGKFRALDFGDMTWDIEYDLMCPNNPIGTVDMYFVSDHGINDNSTPEFVHAIRPRVAVMQNSARKGNAVDVLKVLRSSPGLEDIWQLHWGNAAAAEWNSAGVYIANGVDPTEVATALTAPPRGWRCRPDRRRSPDGPRSHRRAGCSSCGGRPGSRRYRQRRPRRQTPEPGRGQPGAQGGTGAGRGGRGAPPHSPAYLIKISVQPDGTFTVTNTRNGFSKTYVARKPLEEWLSGGGAAVPLAAPASPRGKTGPPARVLTMPASVGVCRTPVSRLFTSAGWPIAVRVLIADAAKDRLRACFGGSRVSRGSEVAAIETAARHRRPHASCARSTREVISNLAVMIR